MVGGFAVELARAKGALVAGAVRESDAAEARRLGVDAVLGASDGVGERMREWAADGVDVCLDTIGLGQSAVAGIRDGGHLVTTVPGSLPEETRGITLETVQVQPDAATLETLARRCAEGGLTIRVAETLAWTDFRRGYEMLRSSGLRGKVVLTF